MKWGLNSIGHVVLSISSDFGRAQSYLVRSRNNMSKFKDILLDGAHFTGMNFSRNFLRFHRSLLLSQWFWQASDKNPDGYSTEKVSGS